MARQVNFTALTAGTQIRSNSGYLQIVNLTSAGDATATVTIYDNPTAATGTILFQSKGTTTGSFLLTAGVSTPGAPAATGMFIVISGATSPFVQVIYE